MPSGWHGEVDRLKPDDQDGAVDRLEQLHTSSVVEVVRVFLHDLPSRQRQIFDLGSTQPAPRGETLIWTVRPEFLIP